MTAGARSYHDACGIARALDAVGERWALLVVRELLLGPKRFNQLRRGLPGLSPNVLSQRLRELEEAGVVHRYELEPPAAVPVYELTERGLALEPVELALGRWGSTRQLTSSSELSPDALLVAMKTTFSALAAGDLRAEWELTLDGERYRIAVHAGAIDIVRGRSHNPAARVATDAATLRSLVFAGAPLAEAVDAGRVTITGPRKAVARLLGLFPRPARSR